MILFIEPISKNIGMYVPAYPLPLMEIASYVKHNRPETDIEIISIPVDYGLPLDKAGKEMLYRKLLDDIADLKPEAVGISCTAIAQAGEVVYLCEKIKSLDPDIVIFVGGYFPTIYHEELLSQTSAIDAVVVGEGELPALRIIDRLKRGALPMWAEIPGLVWKNNGRLQKAPVGERFDLKHKALLNLKLLKHPGAYDILPYAFSRGCPYQCNFCMEDYIRPRRRKVPVDIIRRDLTGLLAQSNTHTLLISDALFKSFDLFPFLRQSGLKINFETRCDVLDPALIPQIADCCGMLVLGFESASYDTLRRMNKVRSRTHYEKYLSNTRAIFKTAARHEIPLMVFMIGGYPGDTEADLKASLEFAQQLSRHQGPGGHVFKIGECHVYPKTKIFELATSLPDVVFDNDGVFGQNVVRQPSKGLQFDTVLNYNKQIFNLSNPAPKLKETMLKLMPLFRIPAEALRDAMIPDSCYAGADRSILDVRGKSLATLRTAIPGLAEKYKNDLSAPRNARLLTI